MAGHDQDLARLLSCAFWTVLLNDVVDAGEKKLGDENQDV